MDFESVIGQEEVKQLLLQEVADNKLPHALLLAGPEGNGAYPLAWALAKHLLKDSKLVDSLQHPDLHLSFPIFKPTGNTGKPTPCDLYLKQWRQMVLGNPYFGYSEWMEAIGADNQQLTIYESESDSLFKKLSYKSNQGGYKVSIIWMPEKMNIICSNKILKLLEEPPSGTVFILVSEHPELLLPTIQSRCQLIEVPSLQQNDIEKALIDSYKIAPVDAVNISRTSYGNFCVALRQITDNSEQEQFFEYFVSLMRLSYARKVKEMRQWSEDISKFGREKQKRFLAYCQRMIRENFIYNFNNPALNYMSSDESGFAVRFAPFINENNVIGIMDELNLAQRDIAQNGNPKIIFFDFALKMIVLIKNR